MLYNYKSSYNKVFVNAFSSNLLLPCVAQALRQGGTNMDVLIALGTSVAYFYSAIMVVADLFSTQEGASHYYFETSAILITFVALGKYLESVTKQGTGSAVKALLELEPSEATLVCEEGSSTKLIPTSLLQRGDVVIVKQGERLPCDGVLAKILGQVSGRS
jgi:P-type Cu+ transporter